MNLTSSSIFAPMLNLFPRKGTAGNKLDIITWNVYVGHKPSDVKTALTDMAKEYNPHIFALQEATNLGANRIRRTKGRPRTEWGNGRQDPNRAIHLPGYRTYHLPKDHPKGLYGEAADTALLIRNDVIIHGHQYNKMKEKWKGPDHGFIHEPRVYQTIWVSSAITGEVWKIGAGHWPFGSALQETINYVHDWFAKTIKGRPTVWVGDLNAMPHDFKSITDLSDVKVVGHRIDQAITRNVKMATAKDIGAHGSDHDAVLIHLEA
ncbi:MAG TPA: endonuclease/exonuclease/phosphatase family protein [Nitrospira sp.]|nr:endonuclease/exonuclease/phosphatase family protein [Nitrospira sp.]